MGGWLRGAQGPHDPTTAHAGPAQERQPELEVMSRSTRRLSLGSVLDGRKARLLGHFCDEQLTAYFLLYLTIFDM